MKAIEFGEKMLRQLTRVSEIPTVVKQLQKVGSPLTRQLHVVCSFKASLPNKNVSNICKHNNGRSKTSSFFGLFQSSAIAGTQKSNNYATEATVQVQRVS